MVNYQTFDTSELRSEFFEEGDEEPQTPTVGSHVIEVEDEALEIKRPQRLWLPTL